MQNPFRTTAKTIDALRRYATVAGLAATLVFSGFSCSATQNSVPHAPLTLTFWSVFDDEEAYADAFANYQKLHPNVSFEYRRLKYDEYYDELVKALAQDRGPDIVNVPATWLRRMQSLSLIKAAPANLQLTYRTVKGGIKKEVVWEQRTEPNVNIKSLANDFVDVVSDDVVIPTEQVDPKTGEPDPLKPLVPMIYGLPLSVDTLALYYNRDILNRSGITLPSTDWKQFQEQVKKITKLDETGTIIQSGAALGTTDNVERGTDIVALLMMQNGAPMVGPAGTATFDRYPPELAGRPYPPGAEALIFYTDFANPEKEVYTWNDKMPNSLQAFENGQTAFFFGYSYHFSQIKMANSKLNFGVAPFPQIEGNKPINFANYWVSSVTSKSKNPNEAWDFVKTLTKSDSAKKFLSLTNKPTALRGLVTEQINTFSSSREYGPLSIFPAQVPSAKSWYHGTDADATEKTFQDMIRQMLGGEADPKKIVELGATKVNQTIK